MNLTLEYFISCLNYVNDGFKIGVPQPYTRTFDEGGDIDGFNNMLQNPTTGDVTGFFAGYITYSCFSTTPLPIIRIECKNNAADPHNLLIVGGKQNGVTAPVFVTKAEFTNVEPDITKACLSFSGWFIPIKLP